MNEPTLNTSEEIDLHRVETPFVHTRIQHPLQVRHMMVSIDANGQRVPLIAVAADERLVLVDGYRRWEALRHLGRDNARILVWHCPLPEALSQVLAHHEGRAFEPIEQAWMLSAMLAEGMSQRALAMAVGKDLSWVNRRLMLLSNLSESLQEAVRTGAISTWAASRVFVPLARANSSDAQSLLAALRTEPLSTRQLATWLTHYRKANSTVRARLLAHPRLFIQTLESPPSPNGSSGPEAQWLEELEQLRRKMGHLRRILKGLLDPSPPEETWQSLRAGMAKTAQTFDKLRQSLQEGVDAHRTRTTDNHSAPSKGHEDPPDQPHPGTLAQQCPSGAGSEYGQTATCREQARLHLTAARAILQDSGERGADPGDTARTGS